MDKRNCAFKAFVCPQGIRNSFNLDNYSSEAQALASRLGTDPRTLPDKHIFAAVELESEFAYDHTRALSDDQLLQYWHARRIGIASSDMCFLRCGALVASDRPCQ